MPTLWEKREGHDQCFALARSVGVPRGQRPQAYTEATCARTGKSCVHPSRHAWDASRSLRTYDDEERTQEVGQTSSDEAREQVGVYVNVFECCRLPTPLPENH